MNTTPKYKLTDETIVVESKGGEYRTLHRIEALRDFGEVKAGDKGGFVQSEENLSQKGNCWIYNDAKVYDNARVIDNAEVFGYAKVYDDAIVGDNAKVYDKAQIDAEAQVYGHAKVYDCASVGGDAQVYDNAHVFGNASVSDNAKVYENAIVTDKASVYGRVQVYGNARVDGELYLSGINKIYDNTRIYKGIYINNYYLSELENNKIICVQGLVDDNGNHYNGYLRLRNGKFEDISVEQFEEMKRIKQEQSKQQDTLKSPAENQNEVKQIIRYNYKLVDGHLGLFLRQEIVKFEDISVEQFNEMKRIKQEQSKKQDTLKSPAENKNEVKQIKPKRGFKI